MPVDRARFIDDPVAGGKNPPEHLMVSTGAGCRSGIQRLIEGPYLFEYGAPQGHVDTRANAGDRERIVAHAVENPALETTPEGAETLEPFLRWRFELVSQCQSRRAQHARVFKWLQQMPQPRRLWHRVVV